MSLLAKNLKRKLDKSDSNDDFFATTHSDKTVEKTEVLKISFNGGDVIEVNKKKLLQKSLYFQAITSPRFNDYQKDTIQVNFNASVESFQQIISYIETDDIIKKKSDNILQVFELATYLQIDCLTKNFKDLFIYNLNIKMLNKQLLWIKSNPLFKGYKEVALKFKKNKKPSVSGLYILESFDDDEIFLRIKSFANKKSGCKLLSGNDDADEKARLLKEYRGMGGHLKIVMQFCDSIIIQDWGDFFYQYNLVTDAMSKIPDVWSYCKLCCDNEKLYALDFDVYLKVFVFRSIDLGEKLEVFERKPFKSIKLDSIISSICYNGKMYILYSFDDDYQFDKDHCFDIDHVSTKSKLDSQLCYVRLLILCTKTFNILNNFKIKDRLNIDENFVDKSCSSKYSWFLTVFHDKKNHKLFIYTGEKTPILVFDVQKVNFYFVENTVGEPLDHFRDMEAFTTDYNNNIVYKLVEKRKRGNKHHNITAYEYVNEKFVNTGFKCDYFADWLSIYFV